MATAPDTSTTNLFAESSSERRDFFGTIKRVLFGAGAVAASSTLPARADEPTTGKIVEIQISNVDGEPGKTGTIKLQLRPEWAPRGVARFEVCVYPSLCLSTSLATRN